MNKNFLKVVFSEMIRIVTFPLRILPVKKNRILFTGLTGGNVYDYSCNPKYLYEYLRDNYAGQFEFVWAVKDKNMYHFLEEEGVKLVKHFTVSSFRFLLTSKVIVTNGSYTPWFPFRKKQYVINTWHGGGAYKKVENAKPDSDWATRKRAEFCADNIDLFLASCKVQEQNMIRTTYQYKGDVLQAGTPRNDKLVRGDIEELAHKVKEKYNIPPNGKIVLYAPTYRQTNIPVVMDSDYLLKQLNKMQFLSGTTSPNNICGSEENVEWFFMSRYHRYQDDSMDIKVTGAHVIDVLHYPDMQELLCAADLLITDYSSCIWDYAFLKRPCYLFVPDREEYTANTGFYVGLEDWPFEQALNMEELVQNIENCNLEQIENQIALHLKKLGSYETGKCCQKICEKICDVCCLN